MSKKFIATTANCTLTDLLVQYLGHHSSAMPFSEIDAKFFRFKDGECGFELYENLYDKEVFVLANLRNDSHVMELFVLLDVLNRSSIKHLHVCFPYFLYARSDRLYKSGVPVTSSMLAGLLSGFSINKVSVIDIHNLTIFNSFSKVALSNHVVSELFVNALPVCDGKSIVVAPDMGSIHRAKACAQLFGQEDIAIIYKERMQPGQSKSLSVLGDVRGKRCIIFDDIVDTAGTLCNAAGLLMQEGAVSVVACITHGLFSGDAYSKIVSSDLEYVYTTNTIESQEKLDKIKYVPVEEYIYRNIMIPS
ncbi:MAG: ribose-phosphate diphosphokinase family protein [Candidatus Xenolissoclinum pacificiensis L6]|uniref:ribose-phosphate diphosphokinase n=1 Tax=Candidatus Xenolissoclinum pacificiensis L6 TaxID=1401685 RepID=W2V157_9RICK|nr:MAG: ribose-phosphate diphosphokinase family protein [Candidatus Xenolissoclinum pacificiensis L6]